MVTMGDTAARIKRWGKRRVTQVDVTNRDCVVPPHELSCPEFSFKLDFDFRLRRRNEGIRGLYDKQRERFCDIITALLSTSGGVLTLHSISPINKSLLSSWLSNAAQLLVCVPRDVLDCGALDYIIHENRINVLVKKAPEIITHKSNLYTRSSDANSYMCNDVKSFKSIMTQEDSASRTRMIPHIYGCLLDPEDRHTEYKAFHVTKSEEILAKLEHDVNCIFALGNIPGGGDVFIGVQEDGQKYTIKGIDIEAREQNQFILDFTEWMVKSRDGAHRIWGEEGTVPVEGQHWRVDFFPLSACPAGEQRFLLQIHINFCERCLFERAPESCTVDNTGHISLLSFQQWREMVLSDFQNDAETITKSSDSKKVETQVSSEMKNVETQTSYEIENKTAASVSSFFKILKSKFKREHQDSAEQHESPESSSVPSKNPESEPSYASKHDRADDQGDLGAVSWAESQSNEKYLSKTRHHSDTSYLTQPCTIPEGDPIQFFPNKDKFVHTASSMIDPAMFPHEKILNSLIQVEDTYKGQPGFAIALISLAEQIGLDWYKEEECGHVFDILVGYRNNLDVWPVFLDMQSDLPLKRCYAYEVCRILKRHLLLRTKLRTVQNLRINPMMYCPQSGSVQPGLDPTKSLVRDINGAWSSREGISKLTLTEALTSLLMAGTDTRIKDRFGIEKHYNLTKMQVRSSMQCLNGIVNMIEGPPGVGKSILVSYLCDVYGGHDKKEKVLCLCPRKPFSKYLQFQDKSTVVHIDSPEKMQEVIQEITDGGYDAVVADDSQDMSLTDKIWATLYLVIYQIWTMNTGKTTRLFIFLDSEMQIFGDINQARIVRTAFRKFIDEHNISFTDLSLHEVLRNTQNVFSFMAANVFQDLTLKECEIYSRHPLPGDDVIMHGKTHLWVDSANNDLLKHILHLLSTYDLSDIVVLVDHEEDAVFLRELFKRCWPAARPSIIVNDATIFPVRGLTVETTHNFLGLEARVCIHARRDDNTRVLDDTRYRVYIASRGTERVDFLFPDPFDAHKARAMGYEDLSTAKPSENTTEATDKTNEADSKPFGAVTEIWRKGGYKRIQSLAGMVDDCWLVITAAGVKKISDGRTSFSSSTLQAFNHQGEPVVLPFSCSPTRPYAIGVNQTSTTVVVVDDKGESGWLVSVYSRQGDSWLCSSFTTRRSIQQAAVTDDSCIACTVMSGLQWTLVLLSMTGEEVWSRSLAEGKYMTRVSVCQDLIVTSCGNTKRVTVRNRQGQVLHTLPSDFIRLPRGVTSDSAGRLIVADKANKSISLFTREGHFIQTLVTCRQRPVYISLSQDRLLLVGEENNEADSYDLSLYELY